MMKNIKIGMCAIKKKKSKGFLVGDMVGKGGIWSTLKSFHFPASTDMCPCRWWEKTSSRG